VFISLAHKPCYDPKLLSSLQGSRSLRLASSRVERPIL